MSEVFGEARRLKMWVFIFESENVLIEEKDFAKAVEEINNYTWLDNAKIIKMYKITYHIDEKGNHPVNYEEK